MSAEHFSIQHVTGRTLYAALWYGNQVRDHLANNWRTTDNGYVTLPVTEYPRLGNPLSWYRLTDALNLSTVNPDVDDRELMLQWYQRLGATPNLTTDPVVAVTPFRVFAGERDVVPGVLLAPGFRRDLVPEKASLWVTVLAGLKPVNLNLVTPAIGWSVTVAVRREGDGADLFSVTRTSTAGAEADGRVLFDVANPGYTAGRTYLATVTVAGGSGSYTRTQSFHAAG